MRSRVVVWFIVACTILALPSMARAQEAAVSGTITDSSGAVLPGVTVQAVHEATGNAFDTVTDQRGAYRIPVRVGILQLTATLQGFTVVTRRIELLVGQTAVVNMQMAPRGVAR